MTATAVCSVTDDPPTVLVCVNRNSAMNEVFKSNGRVVLNVLSGEHENVAKHFAGMTGIAMDDRFARDGWHIDDGTVPVLPDALVNIAGRIDQVVEVGTHSVLLIAVDEIRAGSAAAGLVYFDREFHKLGG
jgi:flavin reductase (NADH)